MTTDLNPEAMSLHSLRDLCAEESERFYRKLASDPRFCYELFRRAVLQQSEQAWEFVYHQYQALVTSWVNRHPAFVEMSEEREYIVNRAFAKLWRGLTPEKFANFPSLESILGYLRTCVNNTLLDSARARERSVLFEEEDDERPGVTHLDFESLEDKIHRRDKAEKLFRMLLEKCKDEKERIIVYASFVLGLKPAEIYGDYPGVFRNVQEVYRIKENFLERLKRDPKLMQFLEGLDE